MATGERDWVAWHREYADPSSYLSQRLAVVQRHIAAALDAGATRVVSACAGEGRDLLGVLAGHPSAAAVRARLVELDPTNAAVARRAAAPFPGVTVLEADAGVTDAYAGAVPADLVLLCGVFGNVTDADVEATVRAAPMLCAPGTTAVWTRHRRAPDLTPSLRRWFGEAGFEELAFDGEPESWSVGAARLAADPLPFEPGRRLFSFSP